MPQLTESETIISSTLAKARSERSAFVASVLEDPEQSGAFLEAVDSLSEYLNLLRTAGGAHVHQAVGAASADPSNTPQAQPVKIEHFFISL